MNIEALRCETPGCAHRIHLNNAGAALMPMPVLAVMNRYLEAESLLGGYETAATYANEAEQFYKTLATLINAQAHNIAYTSSATDAYARAISAIPFQAGDVILTTQNDYISNQFAFIGLQQRLGVSILRARDLEEGGVDVQDMIRLMDEHTPKLVAVTHIPTNSGLIQPVNEIGAACQERNIWYAVDACQSAGQMPLDVRAIQCDFLSATFRKFLRGPRGTGFLYVSDRALAAGLTLYLPDMRSGEWASANRFSLEPSAKRFEYWEIPYNLMLGAEAAARYALNLGLASIQTRSFELAATLRTALSSLPKVRVLDKGVQKCAIVTMDFQTKLSAEAFKKALDVQGFNTSLSFRNFALLDYTEKQVEWALRASPHYYNTEAEIAQFVEALAQLLG